MTQKITNVLIIADIEGSSGCWNYAASSFMTDQWCEACVDMSLDVNAVVSSLLDTGIEHITVKDFHRTGFNLLPELIDARIRIVSGYHRAPVPGIGDPGNAQVAMFMGMHAASGSSGFLAHTLTSRIEKLEVNTKSMAEIELFSASLAPFGIRPIFFSGCPIACHQAQQAVSGIDVYPIDKSVGAPKFDRQSWRAGLAKAAVESLKNDSTRPFDPIGPFEAIVHLRDGPKAAMRIAKRWSLEHQDNRVFIHTDDIHLLYQNLIRICYLTPLIERLMPVSLPLYNLWGSIGRVRARWRLKRHLK